MREDGFRFSHDKRFSRVSFGEFLATARALYQIVSDSRSFVDIEVMTAEDLTTYDYTTTTFISIEIDEALKNRKRYLLDELTREVWDKSFHVQVTFTLRDERNPEPFAICVWCDKYGDAKCMKFYGQYLDEKTRQAVVSKFRCSSLAHSIGDGMLKISTFNMLMGQRLTGIKFPIKR